jgi:carboxypeptidase family protein
MRKVLFLVVLLIAAIGLFGQSARVTGHIVDSSGAVMPGAQIKVYQDDKVVKQGVSSPSGDFEIPVDPGEYKIEISAPDFGTYTEMVRVTPGMGPLAITMSLAQLETSVEVTETRNQISVDPDSSLNTTVLDKDFIDALPDDEDELTTYLQQIAGSRGGPGNNGGDFVIDGFSNGRVPPKDQIQEIRINNNPFSSEFSGVGFGRLEIITKAGTGDYHGNMNFMFRDESLNARNPFAATKPPYQQRNFNSNFSGPLIRNKLSLNMNLRNSDFENSDTIRATLLLPDGQIQQLGNPVVMPNINRNINARSQWAITNNNTLNFNVEYGRQDNKNQGVGGFNLAERASVRKTRNNEIQLRETAILTKSLVHETRFEFRTDRNSTTPITSAVAVNVQDSFFAGGGQNRTSNNNRSTEFGDLLMYSSPKWTLKTGLQGTYRMDRTRSENNFLGTFLYSSLLCRTPNPADPKDDPCLGAYAAGRPTTFTINSGNPVLDFNQLELGSFVQTDWKASKVFTLSLGARYEAQTNIDDHNNLDPRLGFGYQLTKTMALRGGAGVFHQRFDRNTAEDLLRLDGTRQSQIVIRNPSSTDAAVLLANASPSTTPASIRVRAADLATPYSVNSSISLEKAMPAGIGLTFSWDSIRGVHLYRSRNLNAPLPGALPNPLRLGTLTPPDPTKGNINQLESTGLSRSNNFTIGFRQQLRNKWNLNVFGNYTLGYAYNDTDGAFSLAANNYDLHSEWGRAGQDTRHRFFTGINFRTLWGINVNGVVNASSSRPYNITTGFDENGDTVTNDRPAGVKRNTGIGPGNFNTNLNFTKTISLKKTERPNTASNNGANPFLEPQRGGGFPGGGFPGGGFPGGGGQRGGGPGGQRGGGPGGQRGRPGQPPAGPTMAFVVNIQNVLNNQQLSQYSGVLTSPFFGRANNARNPRQIEVGMRVNF